MWGNIPKTTWPLLQMKVRQNLDPIQTWLKWGVSTSIYNWPLHMCIISQWLSWTIREISISMRCRTVFVRGIKHLLWKYLHEYFSEKKCFRPANWFYGVSCIWSRRKLHDWIYIVYWYMFYRLMNRLNAEDNFNACIYIYMKNDKGYLL